MDLAELRAYLLHPASGLNEDVVQETLIRYSRMNPSPRYPKAWCLKVARNLMNMERRHDKIVLDYSVTPPDDLPLQENRDPLRFAESRQELGRYMEHRATKKRSWRGGYLTDYRKLQEDQT